MILGQSNLEKLHRGCSVSGYHDQIRYREALQRLTINMEVDEPFMKEWVVRMDADASVYSNVATTLRSFSQTRSMMSKTNQLMRSMGTKSAMRIINKTPANNMKIMDDLNEHRASFIANRHGSKESLEMMPSHDPHQTI